MDQVNGEEICKTMTAYDIPYMENECTKSVIQK